MLKPVAFETVSVVDAVVKRLRTSLFAGEYAAGQELKDTQIASDFNIARPTARAVVQQLVAERMLERSPGHSARVRSFDAAQVADIYRVRRLVELYSVRSLREQGGSLDGAAEALVGFETADPGEDWVRIAAADMAFHTAIVREGGSPRLQDFFDTVVNEARLLIALLRGRYERGAALRAEHAALLDLLRDAPLPEVEAAWREHLDDAERYLTGLLASES
jgi:DNA-binding GntR family transcriptional regulator